MLALGAACSTIVPMADLPPSQPATSWPATSWPRPPRALPAARLMEPPAGARVTVAGLVLVRQRPGTAKGVIFVTLEDETGTCNVVVWAKVYERFRRAVIAGRLLRVTGRLQREAGVVHVVADLIEDLSPLLDRLLDPSFRHDGTRAGDQP
jgi:DNA polymerase III alpha subunit